MRILIYSFLTLSFATVQAQLPVSTFTDYAEYEEVRISPKGTYLAFTQHGENREYLTVLSATDLSPVSKSSFGADTDVASFFWVNDERILLTPSRSFRGGPDFKQPTGEIFGINADGKKFEVLFGRMAGTTSTPRIRGMRESINAAGRIVDLLPDDPDKVIIQSIGYGVAGEFNQSWVMDVRTGKLQKLRKSPIRNGTFSTDANHEIRYVFGANIKNINELYFLNEDDEWELLVTDEDEINWVAPAAPYGEDGKMLVTNMNDKRMSGVSIWDPLTGKKESIFHHNDVDVSRVFTDNDNTIWAIQYIDHYPDYFYPDESHPLVGLHQNLRKAFPALDVQIVDETDDLSKVIVYLTGPQNPGDFVVMDTQKLKYLLRLPRYPNLPVKSLSRVDPIKFVTRDGTEVRGYLTMPVGKAEKNLPMVVLPHGGPHGPYDRWGYNFETQMLANNSYAVLQVNFRGSGGRGKNFEEAGYGEWGGKMQDDITDAVRWTIKDGVADPDRICIYGASYGAYAALTGAFKEPDLFKCAIGLSGVYDLNLMFKRGDIKDAERGISFLKEVLGEDKALLESRSPVANAGKIKADDVMLIHGKLDPRAPYVHATRMKDALEKAGKEVTWVVERREVHGIMSEKNRVEVYKQLLAFLEKNIGK